MAVPGTQRHAKSIDGSADFRAIHQRNDDAILDNQFVQANELRCSFDGFELAAKGAIDLVVFRVAPARDVAALPLVVFGSDLPGDELIHKEPRIGCSAIVEHLEIGIELGERVRVGHVRGKEYGRRDRFELEIYARLLAGHP